MNVALLVIRALLGLLFIGHGTQKLFGWFGGHGLSGTERFFAQLGYRRGRAMAVTAGLGEALGGGSIAAGLLTPLGCAAVIGVMFNAIVAVHWSKGLWVDRGGFEYPLVMSVVAVAIAWSGPGIYSIDHAIGTLASGVDTLLIALVLGVLGGAAVLLMRSPEAASAAREEQQRGGSRRAA